MSYEIEHLISNFDVATFDRKCEIIISLEKHLSIIMHNNKESDRSKIDRILKFVVGQFQKNPEWLVSMGSMLTDRLGEYGRPLVPHFYAYCKNLRCDRYDHVSTLLIRYLPRFGEEGLQVLLLILERYVNNDYTLATTSDLEDSIASYGRTVIPQISRFKARGISGLWDPGKRSIVPSIINKINNPG